MSAHVLFILSNEFEESDKMRGEASVLSLFRNELINSILQEQDVTFYLS